MKTNVAVAGLLITTVAGKSVGEPVVDQPHIEPEMKISSPSMIAEITSGGEAEQKNESLGRFRGITLYRKMLRANWTKRAEKNELAPFDAYVETARAIVNHYPNLKLWERQFQYDCIKHDIELTKMRTGGCNDCSEALIAVAQILRCAGCGSPISARSL